jgi:hypothetical protein
MGNSFLLAATGILVVGLATGQQPFQGGKGFGGGFLQQSGAQDPLVLLRNDSVKKELKVTDEQLAKLPDAVKKALADILTKEQLSRLNQIELQQKGPNAFKESAVQKTLNITPDQKEDIKIILDDSTKAVQELLKEMAGGGGFGGGFQGIRDKLTNLQKDTNEKIVGILTADQKKQWRTMVGDDFKLELPAFGGFGKGGENPFGKGKGGFKKKDGV